MSKFPVDASLARVLKALGQLGFDTVREGNHIALTRQNVDGTLTPLTLPNHAKLKGSTLRTVLTQAGIPRDVYLEIYETM